MEKEIKQITINFTYGCFGMADFLSRDYMTFSKNKVEYFRKSIEKATIINPNIRFSYHPNEQPFSLQEEKSSYEKDFKRLCKLTDLLETKNSSLCDAVSASVVIKYADGSKKVIENLSEGYGEKKTPFDQILELTEKYTPKALKER